MSVNTKDTNMKITDVGEHEILLGFLGPIGVTELVVILLIVLLLFGAKKIPELAKGLGGGLREFKKAASELRSAGDDAKTVVSDETPSAEKTVDK